MRKIIVKVDKEKATELERVNFELNFVKDIVQRVIESHPSDLELINGDTLGNLFTKYANPQKKLSDMEQKIADFEQSQHNYHDQSINIRDDLRTNQNTLSTQLTDLTTLMQNFITNQDECTVASFRSSLWRMHRDFMAQGYITPDGLKTFLEMGKLYEKAGGNDIYHEKLLPDIESLEVRYTKDNVL